MNLELTQEQTLLADTFARFFKDNAKPEDVRRAEPLGYDPALWQQLVELGTPATRVAEKHGGLGLALRDNSLINYQAGYSIAAAPIAESTIAAKILSDCGDETSLSWLEKLLGGTALIGVAPSPATSGEQQIVPAGAIADGVIALVDDQLVLIFDQQCETENSNLGSQPIARWTLTSSGQSILCSGDSAKRIYQAAMEEWKLLIAAQLSGINARALEYAAEYSNERSAFGVKIGSFQGLSHPMADAAIANDGIRLLIDYAIWKLEQHHDDASAHIAMAYWWATEACAITLPHCVQMFGGYGVSLEHDIQLFARRGIALSAQFGDRQQELTHIAQRLWGGHQVYTPDAGTNSIDFALGEKAEALRARAEAFFDANLNQEHDSYRGHSWDGYHPEFYKKLAAAKLLFPEWPEDWGGLNATPAESLALTQVFYQKRWTLYPQGTSRLVAEMINKFGCEELKQEILPQIINGDAICCLGLTEPHCGSDVFAAQTKAVKQGDKWLINGQKMFTSGANIAKYVMLFTNTNPEAPKHVGKTLFIVPMNHPGVEVHRVDTVSEDRTNITYYSDVEIDDKYRLGDVDAGSKVMGYMLSLEQGGNPAGYEFQHMIDQAVNWALNTSRNGRRVFEDPLAQMRLGRAITERTVAETMLLRITEQQEKGQKHRHYGSMLKAFVCEAWKKNGAELINMAAPDCLFSNTADLHYIEGGWRSSLASTIYAGTTQVHRSVVAETALGMPRSRMA